MALALSSTSVGNNPTYAEVPQGKNPDCTFSATGYGSITVPIVGINYTPNIIATEDQAQFNRIFYPRQCQLDTFSVTAIFAMTADRDKFFHFLWGYINFAIRSISAIPMRVQCPARNFDWKGIPHQGWHYRGAPVALTDVTWQPTIDFMGASPTNGQTWVGQVAGQPGVSYYSNPPLPADPGNLYFYPSNFQGGAGSGSPSAEGSLYDTSGSTSGSPAPGAVQSVITGHPPHN